MSRQRVTGPRRWIPAILLVAGAAVFLTPQLLRVVRNAQEDGAGALAPMIGGLSIVIVFTAALVAWFVLQSRARRARIERLHPGARQLQFVPTSDLAAGAATLEARISTAAYGTMVIFDHRLKLFVGGGDAPRVDLPVDAILDVSVGESRSGARWMRSIDVTATGPNGPVLLPIVPMRDSGNVFRTFTDSEVEAMAQQLRQEIGVLE